MPALPARPPASDNRAMGRILILVVLVLVAVWLLKRAFAKPRPPADSGKPLQVGDLVSCARCGVLLPAPESRESEGRRYCSDEHARLGPGDGK